MQSPHITSQPTCSFCCNCILQTAIAFAEAAYPRKAWHALRESGVEDGEVGG